MLATMHTANSEAKVQGMQSQTFILAYLTDAELVDADST